MAEKQYPYMFLIVNPQKYKYSFYDIKVGDEDFFNLKEDGKTNSNSVKDCYKKSKPNDIVIGYESGNVKHITSVLAVSKSFDLQNQCIWVKKIANLKNPIPLKDFITIKDTGKLRGQTLSSLTEEEYMEIKKLIVQNNPILKNIFEKLEQKQKDTMEDENFAGKGNGTQEVPKTDLNEHHPLNLILYGPPGTGKTYNTVNEALDIIQPKWREDFISQQNLPEGIKDERDYALYLFNKYKEEGRIVFTTFHQSLSYEEFIEGIKPINGDTSIVIKHNNANTTGTNQFGEGFSTIDDLNMMRYEVKSGIFKDICLKAAQNSQSNYDECYEKFIKDIAEYEYFELQTSKQSKFYVSVNRNNNLKLYTTENKNLNGVLTKENIYATHLGELDYWKGYMQGVLKHLKDKYNFKDSQNEKTAPYVLIIDEINRGNVSQIFGELITLIEEDKRTTKWDKDQKQYVDNPEKITVKLPYSPDEKPFGVPGNLYIIGTMNTADRSVEALDTALRRRFDFKEMMPKPELVKGSICGYALKDILSTINDRIRVLKDREHQIGHSYFMKYKNPKDLINVFKNNIVPLLQEYFYGNYAYIGLVLGDGFVKKENAKPEFASLDGYTYDSDNEPTYRLLTDGEWNRLLTYDKSGKLVHVQNALDNLKVNKSDTSENVAENKQLS